MATVVIMPRQGQSVESCVITAFNKKVGDTVEKGEVLFSYETDKSSFDEPAPEAGKILAIFREEGDDVPCLENVLVIGADGEDVSAFAPAAEAAPAAAEAPAAAPAPAPAPTPAAPDQTSEILRKLGVLTDAIQSSAILQSNQPQQQSADDILAEIIRPPQTKGDNN